jgi:hypothetical protein
MSSCEPAICFAVSQKQKFDIRIGLGVLMGLASLVAVEPADAGGIYRDGAGARALALGGASVGQPDAALEAMQSNAAGLSAVKNPQLQLGLGGALPVGEFSNVANSGADLADSFGAWPEVAFAFPLSGTPVTLGLAVHSGCRARWRMELCGRARRHRRYDQLRFSRTSLRDHGVADGVRHER